MSPPIRKNEIWRVMIIIPKTIRRQPATFSSTIPAIKLKKIEKNETNNNKARTTRFTEICLELSTLI